MYGLINKALKQFTEEKYGEETWNQVMQSLEIFDDTFPKFEYFSDDITYQIVGKLSEETGTSAEQLLQDIGKFWLKFIAIKEYENILRLGGNNFRQFIARLNRVHAGVQEKFPELQPPQFFLTDVEENSFVLHYHSQRDGLLPLVIGILKGLAEKFNVDVKMRTLRTKEQGHDHDEIAIIYASIVSHQH